MFPLFFDRRFRLIVLSPELSPLTISSPIVVLARVSPVGVSVRILVFGAREFGSSVILQVPAAGAVVVVFGVKRVISILPVTRPVLSVSVHTAARGPMVSGPSGGVVRGVMAIDPVI